MCPRGDRGDRYEYTKNTNMPQAVGPIVYSECKKKKLKQGKENTETK